MNAHMIAARIRYRAALLALLISAPLAAQELVISTGSAVQSGGPGPLVVIEDLAHELPNPVPFIIAPVPDANDYPDYPPAVNPHGLALLSRDKAVGSHYFKNFVDIFDLPSASLDGWFFPGGAPDQTYYGLGTIALDPAGAYLLLASGSSSTVIPDARNRLFVVPTPISSTSVASDIIALPGDFGTAQTHGIVFDPVTRRAYVGHTEGITAIDPPYTAADVAFTIPLPTIPNNNGHALSYSVELSPDASTLLSSGQGNGTVYILHAPFSASSTPQSLVIPGASFLDGIAIAPDGGMALVVNANPQPRKVFAIAAPFSAGSAVETINLENRGLDGLNGFEDVAISPDGQTAALTGNGTYSDPLIVLRAPFTDAGVSAYAVGIPFLGLPYGGGSRGAGTVKFWTEPGSLPPQITIDHISVTEGNTGMTPATLTVSLSKPSTQVVSVDYATENHSAHAGVDYLTTSGTLTFPPGTRTRTISVPVIGNTTIRSQPVDLFFRVALSNGVNALVRQEPSGPGNCTIVDDDQAYISTEPPIPDATVGVPYSFQFEAVGFDDSVVWQSIGFSLPRGLGIDYSTGLLHGIPYTPTLPADNGSGYFVVNAQAFFGSPSARREYHITVRSDVIFANGFEIGGLAPPAIEAADSPTHSPPDDDAPWDPGRMKLLPPPAPPPR